MRPVRIIATTIVVAAALAGTGCTAHRTAGHAAASASSGASSVTTAQPTAGSTETTTTTVSNPATASCALAPTTGPAGARVTLTCRGFAAAEPVDVTFGATVLASAKASTGGHVVATFTVPDDFAGATIPGRRDTFQAKGRHSGKAASATFTVASVATATCAVSPKTGVAGSGVTLTCRGFAPSEPVDVRFGAVVVATAKATTGGEVAASFTVPSGFAGSHYPGRKDTFQAKGRQSGAIASATFTVTG
jgi:hypothetical protein